MKLLEIEIENVSSFKNREKITFGDGLNLFIGPNGGGKTNLLEIIDLVLIFEFVSSWEITEGDGRSPLKAESTLMGENVNEILFTNKETGDPNKHALLTFEVTKKDIENILLIKKNLEKLDAYQKKIFNTRSIKSMFYQFPKLPDLLKFVGKRVTYRTLPRKFRGPVDGVPHGEEEDFFYALFESYLSFYDLISYLIEKINLEEPQNKLEEFDCVFMSVPTFREISDQAFDMAPKPGGFSISRNNLRKAGLRKAGNLLDYSQNYLLIKFLDLGKVAFDKDEMVTLLREKLDLLGFEFLGSRI